MSDQHSRAIYCAVLLDSQTGLVNHHATRLGCDVLLLVSRHLTLV